MERLIEKIIDTRYLFTLFRESGKRKRSKNNIK